MNRQWDIALFLQHSHKKMTETSMELHCKITFYSTQSSATLSDAIFNCSVTHIANQPIKQQQIIIDYIIKRFEHRASIGTGTKVPILPESLKFLTFQVLTSMPSPPITNEEEAAEQWVRSHGQLKVWLHFTKISTAGIMCIQNVSFKCGYTTIMI